MTNTEMMALLKDRGDNLPSDELVKKILEFLCEHPWIQAFANNGVVVMSHFDRTMSEDLDPQALDQDFSWAMNECYSVLYHLLSYETIPTETRLGQMSDEEINAEAEAIVQRCTEHLVSLGYQVTTRRHRANHESEEYPSYEVTYSVQASQGFVLEFDSFLNVAE